MQTDSQQTEGSLAVVDGDRDTLSRWWCELNVFEWPSDFPLPKPDGWDAMNDMQRREAGRTAWEAINTALPYPDALEYWNNVFLVKRRMVSTYEHIKNNS